MTDPVYSIVLVFHILFAVIGFGALLTTGIYARCTLDPSGARPTSALERYFRPGRNLASRCLYAVPILGGVLLALGHGQDLDVAYPWIGLGLWFVATAVASGAMWPLERTMQTLVATDPHWRERGEHTRDATRLARLSILTTACFVAAVVIMIAQPG